MSNLTHNDVLETGVENNDTGWDNRRWDPITLKTALPLLKSYCKENFTLWKTVITVISLMILFILFYLAAFAGQLQTRMENFGRNNCCRFVNVSSKGSGSTEYPQMMGKYEKFFTDRYGVSTYKRNTFILFKYYAGSTHTTWLISTYHHFNKHLGWIKHSHCWEEKCPEVCETSKWDFWKNGKTNATDEGNWETDQSLTIQCIDN